MNLDCAVLSDMRIHCVAVNNSGVIQQRLMGIFWKHIVHIRPKGPETLCLHVLDTL